MNDPKRVQILEIHRNRQPVGSLERTPKGCLFRYTDDFLESSQEAIARNLPKTKNGIETHGLLNLPTFFAGLLPEGIMQDAIVRHQRLSKDDLFSQLAITGHDAIGDVTAHIPEEPHPTRPTTVEGLAEAINQMAHENKYHPMGAISGAQPKMSIGQVVASQRTQHAIVKVPPRDYPGILPNEAYFMALAPQAGLRTAKVRLENDVLVIERFDRIGQRGSLATQVHVEDALQVLDMYPNRKYTLDYMEILDAARNLQVGTATFLELLRLYAYSYAIGNGDLHAKNVSFEYNADRRQWRLTPAYDLLCTLPYFENPGMALALNEDFGRFEASDFVKAGAKVNLPEKSILGMLRQVGTAVQKALSTPPPIPPEAIEEIHRRSNSMTA